MKHTTFSPPNPVKHSTAPPPPPVDPYQELRTWAATFRSQVRKIPHSPNLVPCVSLSHCSVPLAALPLFVQETGLSMGVILPTIVIGKVGHGRLMFVGRFSIIGACHPMDAELLNFLESICRSCAGDGRKAPKTLLLDWPPHATAQLLACFVALDIQVDVAQSANDLRKYRLIITTTECIELESLAAFLDGAGGVIMCAMGNDEEIGMPVRHLLEKFGIGIPSCSALVGDPTPGRIAPTPPSLDDRFSLPQLIQKFIEKMNDPLDGEIEQLDRLITSLRYHLSALTGHGYEELVELTSACWNLLDTTGAAGESMVCSQMIHCLVSVLVSDLLAKVPPRCFDGMDRSLPFPGACSLEPENFTISLEINGDHWISTGVFLIPGRVATVKVSSLPAECWVQAGSHLMITASRSGLWNRYPAVSIRLPLKPDSIEICSPFGGIVYIISEEEERFNLDISFYNVGRYPIYSRGNPALWETTRQLKAPWSEIETQFVIFTVPTEFLRQLTNIESACTELDTLLASLLTFICDECVTPYRVVFDVEMSPAARRNFYPLVMPLDYAPAIFQSRAPLEPLIHLLHRIAFRSFPPASMPTNAREALAALGAYSVALEKWPSEAAAIRGMVRTPSPLFALFLKIYQISDKQLFPAAIAAVRPKLSATGGKGRMAYGLFVKRLAQACGNSLTRTLLDDSVTVTRPDVGYELGASENLEEFHLNSWEAEQAQ